MLRSLKLKRQRSMATFGRNVVLKVPIEQLTHLILKNESELDRKQNQDFCFAESRSIKQTPFRSMFNVHDHSVALKAFVI